MQNRRIVAIDKDISLLSCGCASFGSRTSARDARVVLQRANEMGISGFDTSDYYGQGDSEKLLGEVLGDSPSNVVVTKAGFTYTSSVGLLKLAKNVLRPLLRRSRAVTHGARAILAASTGSKCFTSKYLHQALSGSLKRLRTQRVDLYLLHSPTIDDVCNGESMDALAEMKSNGEIAGFGVATSLAVARQTVEIYGDRIAAVEVPISLLTPMNELRPLLDLCTSHNVGILAREPLANGLLAKFQLPDSGLLDKHRLTMSQVALQYVASFPQVKTIVCGMSSTDHLLENIAAFEQPSLTESELAAVSSIAQSSISARGTH